MWCQLEDNSSNCHLSSVGKCCFKTPETNGYANKPLWYLTNLCDLCGNLCDSRSPLLDYLTMDYYEVKSHAIVVGFFEDFLGDDPRILLDGNPEYGILDTITRGEHSWLSIRSISKHCKLTLLEIEKLEEQVVFLPDDELQCEHIEILMKYLL